MSKRLEMFRGRDATFDAQIYDTDGVTPLDLTGTTLTFTLKRSLEDSDVQAVAQKVSGSGIIVASPYTGSASINIGAYSTAYLTTPATLVWDLVLTDSLSRRYTLIDGEMVIKPNVTR